MNLLKLLQSDKLDGYKKIKIYLATCRKPEFGTWKFSGWQIKDIFMVVYSKFDELMILRNRAGSKTRDMVCAMIYLAYQINKSGELNRCIWFSGSMTQLQIVKRYLRQHRYVKEVTMEEVRLFNGNVVYLRIMTQKQSVSSRADYIFFDEEQGYDSEVYQMALGIILEGSGKLIHIGTTELYTVFEQNFRRLKQKNLVLEHTIEDCPWINKDRALAVYEGLPDWVIQSQLYCKWVYPGGNVFEKVYLNEISMRSDSNCFYGVDPNPVSGHYLCGVSYIDYQGEEVIYVHYLESFKNPEDLILKLIELKKSGSSIEVEQQFGLDLMKIYKNEVNRRFGFKSADYEFYVNTVAWTEKSKLSRVRLIREKKIYIHPKLRKFFDRLLQVGWSQSSLDPKIEKNPDMHDIDAFMHACCKYGLKTPTLMVFDDYYKENDDNSPFF